MFADYVLFAAVAVTSFVLGWVVRSYLETRRKREQARIRAITGARKVVARPGTTPAVVRQARLSRGDIK